MTKDEMIVELENKGFKRWTKGDKDRLYFNPRLNGILVCTYYRTGNIRNATLDGTSISNTEARRVIASKVYVDVATWTFHSDYDDEFYISRVRKIAGITA